MIECKEGGRGVILEMGKLKYFEPKSRANFRQHLIY